MWYKKSGYTFLELLAVLGIASVLMVSLSGLVNTAGVQYQLAAEPIEQCQSSYWHGQQQADEHWIFGEASHVACNVEQRL